MDDFERQQISLKITDNREKSRIASKTTDNYENSLILIKFLKFGGELESSYIQIVRQELNP